MAHGTQPCPSSPSPSLPPRIFRPIAPSPTSSQLLPLHRPVPSASPAPSPTTRLAPSPAKRPAPLPDLDHSAALRLPSYRVPPRTHSPPPAAACGASARRFASFNTMRGFSGARRGGGAIAEDEPSLLLGVGGLGAERGSSMASLRRFQTALPTSSESAFDSDALLGRHGSVRVPSRKKAGMRCTGGGEPTKNDIRATLTPLSDPRHVRVTRKLRALFRRRRRSSPPQEPSASGESLAQKTPFLKRDSFEEHGFLRPISSDVQLPSGRLSMYPTTRTPDRLPGEAREHSAGPIKSAASFDSESGISDVTWESNPTDAAGSATTWADSVASTRNRQHTTECAAGVVNVAISRVEFSVHRKLSFKE